MYRIAYVPILSIMYFMISTRNMNLPLLFQPVYGSRYCVMMTSGLATWWLWAVWCFNNSSCEDADHVNVCVCLCVDSVRDMYSPPEAAVSPSAQSRPLSVDAPPVPPRVGTPQAPCPDVSVAGSLWEREGLVIHGCAFLYRPLSPNLRKNLWVSVTHRVTVFWGSLSFSLLVVIFDIHVFLSFVSSFFSFSLSLSSQGA